MTASWRAHPGIILSSIVTRLKEDTLDSANSERFVLVTGGNDDHINVRSTYGASMPHVFTFIP